MYCTSTCGYRHDSAEQSQSAYWAIGADVYVHGDWNGNRPAGQTGLKSLQFVQGLAEAAIQSGWPLCWATKTRTLVGRSARQITSLEPVRPEIGSPRNTHRYASVSQSREYRRVLGNGVPNLAVGPSAVLKPDVVSWCRGAFIRTRLAIWCEDGLEKLTLTAKSRLWYARRQVKMTMKGCINVKR